MNPVFILWFINVTQKLFGENPFYCPTNALSYTNLEVKVYVV
jgi:hypothetical protein